MDRKPILRTLIISKVPKNLNIGEYPIKIFSVHGNGVASDIFTYVLPPQEYIIGKTRNVVLDITDTIIKKQFESTDIEIALEPAGVVAPDNLVFEGFPAIFNVVTPLPFEDFVIEWVDYAKMTDNPIEESFEETPVSWNDLVSDGWTHNEISPEDNLTPNVLAFGEGDDPNTPTKEREDYNNWHETNLVALVQSIGNFHNAGVAGTHVLTLPTTPTPGNIIILISTNGARQISSIAQTGVTWVQVGTPPVNNARTQIWYGHTILPGASTAIDITLNVTDSSGSFIAAEYSGVIAGVSLDVTQLGTGNSATLDVAAILTTQPVELWIAAFGTRRSDTAFSGVGFGFTVNHLLVGNGQKF